jgi:ring-1,2-phenylacetyl-CoA epoxidase subunit PaaD
MVTKEAILEVLRAINDPEMPINIIDLGIVENVEIEAVANSVASAPGAERGGGTRIVIDLLPTFVGCPALHAIEEEVRQRVGALPGVDQIMVHFHFDPPWTVDRITASGREALKRVGVTVPGDEQAAAPECPICGSSAVHLESPFGPTRCRMIYYCDACRSSFEHLKRVRLSH